MYKNSSFDFFGVEMLKIKTDNTVGIGSYNNYSFRVQTIFYTTNVMITQV